MMILIIITITTVCSTVTSRDFESRHVEVRVSNLRRAGCLNFKVPFQNLCDAP